MPFLFIQTTLQRLATTLFLILLAGAPLANAQTAEDAGSTLPSGANALRETYGDWTVVCASADDKKRCLMRQEQRKRDTKQLVLAAELLPTAGDTAALSLVLPFGLKLADGVRLQVDDGPVSNPVPFVTCLPVGCIAAPKVSAELLKSFKSGTVAKLGAASFQGGQKVGFSISLKGFTDAYNRLKEFAAQK